jgi:hypothetical protein
MVGVAEAKSVGSGEIVAADLAALRAGYCQVAAEALKFGFVFKEF